MQGIVKLKEGANPNNQREVCHHRPIIADQRCTIWGDQPPTRPKRSTNELNTNQRNKLALPIRVRDVLSEATDYQHASRAQRQRLNTNQWTR